MSSATTPPPPPNSSGGGGGTVDELFTTVPVDLFRSGNSSSPRLDNIRAQDVPIEDMRFSTGEVKRMVRPDGGISTFDGYVAKPGVKWWKIPKGTKLPETIRVVKDHYNKAMRATHYSLRPARLMTLLEFSEGLRELAKSAVPMFTLPATGTGAQDEHEEKGPKVAKQ